MRAHPEFFGQGEETMFGWLHPAAPASDRRTVVVLCPTLGFDQTCSYHAWRILAERMAAAGFGVLRFDYLGTGDSAEEVEESQQVARWLRSVAVAAAHARARTGADRVALLGLRLGGTLAASAARGILGVDALVLWCPFRSGKQYVREVTALARLSQDAPSFEPGGVEAAGFLTVAKTIDDLRGLDLLSLRERPAPRTLLIEREGFSSDQQLVAHLTQLGSNVTVYGTPSTQDEPIQRTGSKVPGQIFDRIVGWLAEASPESAIAIGDAAADSGARDTAQGNGWHDEVISFGPDHRLFGILTRPASEQALPTAVIFLNTGNEHHVGPHGMYVPLARAWAREGYPSFRFDIGGLGDSRPPAGVPDNEIYPAHAMQDVSAAIAEVRRMTQARRLVVIGICSGGWHAFLAARDGLPVDGIIAINAPLYMREGPQYTIEELEQQQELLRYGRSIADPDKWKKALEGRVSVRTFVRLAATGALRWLRGRPAALGVQFGRNNLGGDLRAIASRKVPASFVFSRTDLALTYFQQHARGPIRRARGSMIWTVVDDGDHTFGAAAAQRTLRDLMEDFLKNGGR